MPSWVGETKPIASSTRSALSENSLPAIGFILSSTRTQSSAVTTPFSPRKLRVMTAKSRSAPSSWLDEVRSFSGQLGQVSSLSSTLGGVGMISSWVTLSAPWRIEVPMQSEPVSPPPMTTTCLPAARIGSLVPTGSPDTRRFCCGRKSMAKWTPARSRPGTGRSRDASAPPASATAS